ncbi:MAG: hypothetical protein WD607_05510, partial [Candidatus Paceibacterota bacterium]
MQNRIILIHGLGGDKDETWGDFPALLKEDSEIDFQIDSYGYESPHFLKQFWKRAPSILNIANGVLTEMKTKCDLENDNIILAGHSLGGIIVKQILLKLKYEGIDHNINKICFFDVPHDGSGYANIGRYISWRNQHLKELTRDSSQLDNLNDQWVDSGLGNDLEVISIISANDDIVSSLSSKSGFRDNPIETINNVDHKSIVKPSDRNSTPYKVFKEFILAKTTVNQYKSDASRYLDDWKKIESQRNHTYQFVTDEKRSEDLDTLVKEIDKKSSIVRLSGASGLGKSRIILEAIEKSNSIDETCFLYYDSPGFESEIKTSIRKIIDRDVSGLIVIDNCPVDLHNELAREANKTTCSLKLITLSYSNEEVNQSIHIVLTPLSDRAIKELLTPILANFNESEIDRVARFVQGYPLMATLIADQFQDEGRLLGSIEDKSIVRKLIEGGGGLHAEEKEILLACSIFDVFGVSGENARKEAKFIAEEVANSDLTTFARVLKKFTRRQIINQIGRYARVVPKPLAVTLAAEWWEINLEDKQKNLIENLPDSLIQSFCTQVKYLDDSPSVQNFSERLFGGQRPFVKAEVLLTEKGSRLFRSFAEVNPVSTSNALYNILTSLSRKDIIQISGDTRRNLVWGLEKLCFHKDIFEKAAWCMLLLASAENEDYTNNATGMFAQLFRVQLSGTETEPSLRIDLLKKAIDQNKDEIDLVVLKALENAINTSGGSRTVGAEYQGTKTPLKEWQPNKWQEVFDYWEEALYLHLQLMKRGDEQRQKVLSNIGNSIRGFVALGRIEMLDSTIQTIVKYNGHYWPEALSSIKSSFSYDQERLDEEKINALNRWSKLLSPEDADLPEKLKIIVVNPPYEHQKDDKGHYIDLASEKAKLFASDIANNVKELLPHLDLLLQGEQKKTNVFGFHLAKELDNVDLILDSSFKQFLKVENSNPNLLFGLFRGVFEKSQKKWQNYLDRVTSDNRLIHFYPNFICTGRIDKKHLDKLLELIRSKKLSTDSVEVLRYGGVTDDLSPELIADFCLKLSEIGDKARWSSLKILYMYCFSKEDRIKKLRELIKQILTTVPLHNEQENYATELHHWQDLSKKLLKNDDENLAIQLANQIIKSAKIGFDYGDINYYIKPLLKVIMQDYGDIIWPIFSKAIIESQVMERYQFQKLMEREVSFSKKMPSILSVLPVDQVIKWCKENRDVAPVFVANCVNIFEYEDEEDNKYPSELFKSILINFGYEERVRTALSSNIYYRGWTGSLVPYLESDKA